MNKRKVNINRPSVSKEEINRQQDFNKVLKRHESASRFSFGKVWLIGGLTVAAAIAFIVVFYFKPEQPQTVASFIDPPIEQLDVQYASYVVSPAKGRQLVYSTGSKINIPPNAFLDEDGQPYEGEVELKYREFHDPVDFFLSGIPMTYDSGGVQYTFESAGMMDIQAFGETGEPLFANPESQIEVQLVSNYSGDRYNLYYLDTAKKRWVNMGKDQVIEPEKKEEVGVLAEEEIPSPQEELVEQDPDLKQLWAEIDAMDDYTEKIEDQKPVKPKKARAEGYIFNIDVEPSEFPEIALFDGMYFEIGEENENFTPSLYQVTWQDVVLTEYEKGKNYKLTLSKGDESHTFIVYPVYKGENYDVAVKMYDQKYQQYQETLAQRKAEEKRKREEYQARLAELKQQQLQRQKAWEEQQKAMMERQRQAQLTAQSKQKIYRAVQVSQFGTWNCDTPVKLPKGNKIFADFQLEGKDKAAFMNVQLIEKSRNAVFTYGPTQFKEFQYNPNAENMLLAVTPDQKLAYLSFEDFAKVPKDAKSYTFNLKQIDKEFETVAEVKAFLNVSG